MICTRCWSQVINMFKKRVAVSRPYIRFFVHILLSTICKHLLTQTGAACSSQPSHLNPFYECECPEYIPSITYYYTRIFLQLQTLSSSYLLQILSIRSSIHPSRWTEQRHPDPFVTCNFLQLLQSMEIQLPQDLGHTLSPVGHGHRK